jgi:hypothetical protein
MLLAIALTAALQTATPWPAAEGGRVGAPGQKAIHSFVSGGEAPPYGKNGRAMGTAEPLLKKSSSSDAQPTAAQLLNKAAPAPRGGQAGRNAVRAFASGGTSTNGHGGAHGGWWGLWGILGVIGLLGFWNGSYR